MSTLLQVVNATDAPKFMGGILSFFILCIVLYILVFVFSYSYYITNKMKLYTRLKFRFTTYALFSAIILLFFVIALIATITQSTGTWNYFDNNFYAIPLSWVLVVLSLSHFCLLLIMKNKINKAKLDVKDFRTEDFQSRLDQVEKAVAIKNPLPYLKKHHTRYLSIVDQKYDIISTMIDKANPEMYQNILLDILLFNDTLTTKWSKSLNNYQLKNFLKISLKFQKKFGKKN